MRSDRKRKQKKKTANIEHTNPPSKVAICQQNHSDNSHSNTMQLFKVNKLKKGAGFFFSLPSSSHTFRCQVVPELQHISVFSSRHEVSYYHNRP